MSATLQWIGELNRTGMGACNDGRLEEAEAKLILALYLSKSTELPCLEAKALNNLGVFYACKKVWDEALIYYEQALSIVYSEFGRNNWFCKAIQNNIMKVLHVH
jgi:tetratricopeptide (TPR) repeat protein